MKLNRLTDNDRNFGPFTLARWKNRFSVMLSSGDEEEGPAINTLTFCGFGWALRIRLPKIIQPFRIRREADWDAETVARLGRNHYFITHEREFGVTLSDMGNGYDFLQVHFGAQTGDSETEMDWCCHLPWKQWDCVRHSIYTPTGAHFYTEPRGADFREYFGKKEECPKVHFGFEDYDGELIVATCMTEEREWHKGTGWFKWLRWFSAPKIHRSLDLAFSAEVGTEKGSWKGGTIGHGIDMLPGESPKEAFQRYCAKTHERKGRKYNLRLIGQCGPPRPQQELLDQPSVIR